MTEGWQRGSQCRREFARAGARRPEGNVSRPFVPIWEECTWAGSIVTERDELMGRMSFSSRFPQYLITAMLDEQLAVATDTPPGTWSMPPVDAITSDHMMPRFRPLNRLCMPYLGISCALKVREARLMRSACVVLSPRPSSSTFLPRFSGCDPGLFVVKLFLAVSNFQDLFTAGERGEAQGFSAKPRPPSRYQAPLHHFDPFAPSFRWRFFPSPPLIAPSSLQLSAQH